MTALVVFLMGALVGICLVALRIEMMFNRLSTIINQGAIHMDAAEQALIDQVQKNTDAEASATLALNGLVAQVQAAVANSAAAQDPVLQALTAKLAASVAPLAAAIVASTPAAPTPAA